MYPYVTVKVLQHNYYFNLGAPYVRNAQTAFVYIMSHYYSLGIAHSNIPAGCYKCAQMTIKSPNNKTKISWIWSPAFSYALLIFMWSLSHLQFCLTIFHCKQLLQSNVPAYIHECTVLIKWNASSQSQECTQYAHLLEATVSHCNGSGH